MNRKLIGILVAGGFLVSAGAHAESANEALMKKSACTACHQIDKKLVGPAFKDVAAKYKGDKTAEAKLIEKVKKGGSGVWGAIPMTPNSPQVKDEDIKILVKWILSM